MSGREGKKTERIENVRTRRFRAVFVVLLLCVAWPVHAQDTRSTSGPTRRFGPPGGFERFRRDHHLPPERAEVEKRLLAAIAKLPDPWSPPKVAWFSRWLAECLAEMSPQDFAKFSKLSDAEAIEEIKAIFTRRREARDEEFLKSLAPTDAERLRKLDKNERRRAIDEMRVAQQLESAIKNAMSRGLISDEEADEARAGDTRKKIEATARLSKQVFLQIHGADLTEMQRERLTALDPMRFFDDEFVQRRRLSGIFKKEDVERFAALDRDERRRVLDALSGSAADVPLEKYFAADVVRRIAELSPDDRRILGRELIDVHMPKRRGVAFPKEVWNQLSEDDRRTLREIVNKDEAIAFAKEKLPELDWAVLEHRLRMRSRIEALVERLSPGDRDRVYRLSGAELDEFLKRHFGDQPDGAEIQKYMNEDAGWRRGQRFFVLPSVAAKLSEKEMADLRKMEGRDAVKFLLERFPEVYGERLERLPRIMRLRPPPEWPQMTGEARVRWIFDQAERPWDVLRWLNMVGERRRPGVDDAGRGRPFGPPDSRPAESRPTRR